MKKKLLRYSLLSALLMLCGGVFAATHDDPTEVLFDFTSAQSLQTLGITAPTEGTQDIEEFTYQGVTLTPYTGTTPVRLNTETDGSYTLRFYKAKDGVKGAIQFSVATGNYITSVVITGNTQLANATPDTGTKSMSSDNKTLTWTPADGATTTSVKFENSGDKTINVNTVTVTYVAASAAGPDYYVVGDMTEWGTLETFKMSVNPDNSAEYMLTKQFAAGNQIKVEDSNGVYYPDGTGNHYTLTKDGTHTIYFRPDGQGGSDWHYGYIYVDDSQATDPEPQPTEPKYYLTGSFNGWVAQDAYEMTLDATSGKYTITTDLTEGDEIKVMKVDGRASYYYPDGMGNGYIVQVTGSHTIVFDPTVTGGTTAADYFTVSDDEAEPQPGLADGYYLVGNFNDWTAAEGYLLTANAAADGEYMITKTLNAGDELKVIQINGTNDPVWYPAEGANYVVKVTGSHDIYFRPAGNTAWAYNYIYLTNDEPTAGAYELTSVSDNGTVKFFVDDEMVTSANENAAVTFTIEPNEGYVADDDVLVEAYVNFEDAQAPGGLRLGIIRVLDYTVADGVYSFTMPAANARVTVTYSVDKSELQELIEDAEELLEELPADSEAAEDLQDAIDDANNVLNNPDATAQDVADAIEDLQDAIDAAEGALAGSTIEVTVPAEGFVTMYLEDNSKLMPSREAGVKLYTVASVDVANEQAVLSSELTIVKGKTPFLLYNETTAAITAKLIMANGTPDAVTPAEEFQGTLTAKTFTADDLANYDHYVLTGKNFYWAAEPGTIPANRCWIQLAKDSGAPAQLAIVFEGGTTGINNVERGALNVEGCYTLDGRRVANPTSGLYIMNGRKFVVK